MKRSANVNWSGTEKKTSETSSCKRNILSQTPYAADNIGLTLWGLKSKIQFFINIASGKGRLFVQYPPQSQVELVGAIEIFYSLKGIKIFNTINTTK